MRFLQPAMKMIANPLFGVADTKLVLTVDVCNNANSVVPESEAAAQCGHIDADHIADCKHPKFNQRSMKAGLGV